MTLAPGTMVNPSVRLVRPLGEGAMGSVWIAEHLALKTEVAVKFVHAHLAAEHPELLKRFEQEASVAARIKSPHVVQTFDHGVMADGRAFIVMEMLEGESLDAMLIRCGPLPVPTIAQVLVQVARALGKAHKLGIVHRDIKPDNIFVMHGEDGIFCKVLDFGIAKETQLPKMGGLTSSGVLIGTPEYMSPEQVMSGREVDAQADLWALAITTYQLLTGRLPFHAEAIGSLVVKLLGGKYVPASQLRPGLGAGVDLWFARAMHRDRAQRFQSAREMAREFMSLVARQPSLLDELGIDDSTPHPSIALGAAASARPLAPSTLSGSSSNLATPSRLRRRRRASIAGAAVALSVLTLIAVVTIVSLRESSPAAEQPSASSETPTVASEPTEPPPTDEQEEQEEPVPASSASAPAKSSASASASAPVKPAPRWTGRPPPPPTPAPSSSGAPAHEDHGF